MKRGESPKRRTPLKRSTKPIKRTRIVRTQTPKRRVTRIKSRAKGIPPLVREAVQVRSGGRCEAMIPGVCSGRAEHLHHRLRRAQGGAHTPENLVALCSACHAHCHQNPAWAYTAGWMIRGHGSPQAD